MIGALAAAGGVIAHNPHRHAKRLWTANAQGELLSFYEAYDGHDEARMIADEIRRRLGRAGFRVKGTHRDIEKR